MFLCVSERENEREWNFYHFAAESIQKHAHILSSLYWRKWAYEYLHTLTRPMRLWWWWIGSRLAPFFLTLSLFQSLCSMNECELVEVNMQMNKVDGTGLSIKMRHIYTQPTVQLELASFYSKSMLIIFSFNFLSSRSADRLFFLPGWIEDKKPLLNCNKS